MNSGNGSDLATTAAAAVAAGETGVKTKNVVTTVDNDDDEIGVGMTMPSKIESPSEAVSHPQKSETSHPQPIDSSLSKRSWPEDIDHDATGCGMGRWAVRVWNNWTYSYMNVVLEKGALYNGKSSKRSPESDIDEEKDEKNHLTSDDLYPVPRQMKSARLLRNFELGWRRQHQRILNENSNSEKDEEVIGIKRTKRLLMKSLWKVATPTFLPAGIFQLISILAVSTMPLVVRQLLFVLEEGVDVTRQGLQWSLWVTFLTLVNGLATQRYRHQAIKTGVALRSAMVNVIYKHALALSPSGKRGLTSGEINNLVAVDAQKLYEVTQELHLVWALPLSIGLVTWFLCMVMGPSTLVGIFSLAGFLPIIKAVTKKMTNARDKRVKLSDERVEIIVSMLMGMRNTKLNGYESKYQARIEAVRKKEMRYLAREQAWWATTLLMTVSSPVLATALTFATFVLTSSPENPHILTAADTFGVLLLFAGLRFPINYAGRLIGAVAQTISAIRRIASFLDRPLREGCQDGKSKNDNCQSDSLSEIESLPLVLTRAHFRVGVPGVPGASGGQAASGRQSIEAIPEDTTMYFEMSTVDTKADNSTDVKAVEKDETQTIASALENGGSRDNLSFTVGEFNFQLRRGEVMVVCGPVGSGKSTLINGILEEAEELPLPREPSEDGSTAAPIPMVQKSGRIAYAPQDPFILNLSLRENILFGSDLDLNRYNRVLDVCALRPDIEQLGGSDLVQIGERGVTLSGGQRQRVSLARAAYKADTSACLILDDPFSALDSGTGKAVFEKLIAAPDALLKNSAVLLVTHASHFISNKAVDKILLLVNGKNEFIGTWEELTTFNDEEHDEQTRRAVDHIQSQVRENTDEELKKEDSVKDEDDDSGDQSHMSALDGSKKHGYDEASPSDNKKIMQKELREHGLSSMKTWFLWFQRAGGIWFGATIVMLMAIDRFFYVAVEWFLAQWTGGAFEPTDILGIEFPAQIDGFSAQSMYLKVFFAIIFVSILFTGIRSEFAVTGGVRATKNVFNSMLGSVLRAPMSYFETIPMGRILNRFTYDTDVNDVTLTQMISMFIISCSWFVASISVQLSILPWSALVLFPVIGMYLLFMYYYRLTGPDLQRIDALSRSPLQSMVSECLEGSTSIRIFHQDSNFMRKFEAIVDVNSSALLNYVAVQRWLSIRMELLGSVVVLFATVIVVCLNDRLQTSPGLVGLLITWCSAFTITLNFLVQTFSETEAAITAIERVDAMADLPSEKAMETSAEVQPPQEWPQNGLLEFCNVSLRYRKGLPLALNDLSFCIPAGKTCGIVGRTGAGKSSITVALFRLVEIEPGTGSILLDGVDLTKLGLSDVRGRGMSIIPQDPFLAGATLRECLDPFEQCTDDEILEALDSVRMGPSNVKSSALSPYSIIDTISPDDLLATKLEEGGSNYSVGERQLLNLARALLSQPRVLVLDEATASIDGETDAFIQKMLRTRFPKTTLLTIAHRLNTIMDYDCVLVMDAGKASEFDAPAKLLENSGGIFSLLVDATGPESSKALRQLAMESWETKRGQ